MVTADVLRRPGPCDHLVQTYTSDRHLAEVVAGYVAAGLAQRETAVMVATPQHLRLFAERLTELGVDVAAALERRQLLALDARETLARFLVDGQPDRDRFRRVVAAALEHVRPASSRGVRLYGEMVELLWRVDVEATLTLERLWNEVLRLEGVSLLCGYRLEGLEHGMHHVLRGIAGCHSHLLPAEDQPRLEDAVDRAYAEVFGAGDDVRILRRLMVASTDLSAAMPDAPAALLALDDMPAVIAADVRTRTRSHYWRA